MILLTSKSSACISLHFSTNSSFWSPGTNVGISSMRFCISFAQSAKGVTVVDVRKDSTENRSRTQRKEYYLNIMTTLSSVCDVLRIIYT